jgi:uncharacterized protein YjbJ (UPF0337 family)
MHKDTIKGAAKEAAGNIEKNVGRATGDSEMEAKGAAREGAGAVQKTVGKVKDAARDALKH